MKLKNLKNRYLLKRILNISFFESLYTFNLKFFLTFQTNEKKSKKAF